MIDISCDHTMVVNDSCWIAVSAERPRRRIAFLADLSGGNSSRVCCDIEGTLAPQLRTVARHVELYVVPDGRPVVSCDAEYPFENQIRSILERPVPQARQRGTFILDVLKRFAEGAAEGDVAIAVVQCVPWDIKEVLKLMDNAPFRLHIIHHGPSGLMSELLSRHPELRIDRIYCHDGSVPGYSKGLFKVEAVDCDIELSLETASGTWEEIVRVEGTNEKVTRNDAPWCRSVSMVLENGKITSLWDIRLSGVTSTTSVTVKSENGWRRDWSLSEQCDEKSKLHERAHGRLRRWDRLFCLVEQMIVGSAEAYGICGGKRAPLVTYGKISPVLVETGAVAASEPSMKYLLLCRSPDGDVRHMIVRNDDVREGKYARVEFGEAVLKLGALEWSATLPDEAEIRCLIPPRDSSLLMPPSVGQKCYEGNAYSLSTSGGRTVLLMVMG